MGPKHWSRDTGYRPFPILFSFLFWSKFYMAFVIWKCQEQEMVGLKKQPCISPRFVCNGFSCSDIPRKVDKPRWILGVGLFCFPKKQSRAKKKETLNKSEDMWGKKFSYFVFWIFQKKAEKAKNWLKRPIFADFQEGWLSLRWGGQDWEINWIDHDEFAWNEKLIKLTNAKEKIR